MVAHGTRSWTTPLAAVLGLAMLGGCSGSGGGPAPAPAASIASFTASPAAIPAGGSSTLAWTVANATSLSLDQGIGTVTGSSRSVSPAATTTYTLTAAGAGGNATASATVTVVPAPVIASFTATPSAITTGQSSTLAWSVSGATGLSLDQGIGAVTGTSRVVSPVATTTYTLTAVNTSAGATASATATATVTVSAPAVYNFGEAPDGTATGYPNLYGIISPAQVGAFPTLLASNGGRTAASLDGVLGALTERTLDAVPGSFTDEDGLKNMVVVLASIPPPAFMTVEVAAPVGSAGGTMYLNVLFDKDMNGAWGTGEWVVQNHPVTLPAPGTSVQVSPPAFAFANGMLLPDPAWMRIALTRLAMAGPDWNGSGLFSSGEVEDYLVNLPTLPGPPPKKLPVLTVRPGGPYTFPGGVGVLAASFDVLNWALVGGNFTYALTRISGNVALNLPWAPPPAPPIPIAGFNPVTGLPGQVTVGGNATSPSPAALPSTWRIEADPVDPPARIESGNVFLGEGTALGDLDFSGSAETISHALTYTSASKTHIVGTSPCPDPFNPFQITNTGNTSLDWSLQSSPPPWISVSPSSGTILPGGSAPLQFNFPCSGYVLGAQNGPVVLFVRKTGTSTPSTGPNTVQFSLTVTP